MGLWEYIQYVLALVFVLALIGLVALLVRRFGAAAGIGGRRGGRISVLETAMVDKRRRLLLIRRDNVEHLVLVGGTQDVVIESGIRAETAARTTEPELSARPRDAVARDLVREASAPRPHGRPQPPPGRPAAAAARNAEPPAAERAPRSEPRQEREARADPPVRPEHEALPELDIRPGREPRPERAPEREPRPERLPEREPRPERLVEREQRPERQPRPRRPEVVPAPASPQAVRPDGPRHAPPASQRAPRPAAAAAPHPATPRPVEPPLSAEHLDEFDDLLLEESPRQPRAVARAAGGTPDEI